MFGMAILLIKIKKKNGKLNLPFLFRKKKISLNVVGSKILFVPSTDGKILNMPRNLQI